MYEHQITSRGSKADWDVVRHRIRRIPFRSCILVNINSFFQNKNEKIFDLNYLLGLIFIRFKLFWFAHSISFVSLGRTACAVYLSLSIGCNLKQLTKWFLETLNVVFENSFDFTLWFCLKYLHERRCTRLSPSNHGASKHRNKSFPHFRHFKFCVFGLLSKFLYSVLSIIFLTNFLNYLSI